MARQHIQAWRWAFFALTTCMSLLISEHAQAQGPKIIIDTNQMSVNEARHAAHLRGADGTWMVPINNPDIDLSLWKYVVSQTGTGVFVSEDGTNARSWVLDFIFTPQIVLQDSTGRYVSVRGNAVVADSAEANRPDVALRYFQFVLYGPPTPVELPLTQLLTDQTCYYIQSGGRAHLDVNRWVRSPGGGGTWLTTSDPFASADYWNLFRLYKLDGGDNVIRPFDRVALQTCNGLADALWYGVGLVNNTICGGNVVSANPNQAGNLIANSATVGSWETFRVIYPNAYITSSQVAPVTHAFVYHEFNDEVPTLYGDVNTQRDRTLSPDLIDGIANRIGRGGIIVLSLGGYDDISQSPGILPTHKQRVDGALANQNCSGVVFEVVAGSRLTDGDTLKGIAAVCQTHKDCFLLLPPRASSTNYADDVANSIRQLKQKLPLSYYRSLKIVLACYSKQGTHVGFIGGDNSIEGALHKAIDIR